MRKIGLIASSLSKTDGWGRYSLEIIDGLSRCYDVRVISYDAKSIKGVEVFSVLPFPLSHFLKMLFCLPKIIKHFKCCDVIHCLVEPYSPIIAIANLYLRKPFIITAHGTYAVKPLYDRGINSLLMKFAYRRADKVICVSNFTKNEILKKCKLNNLEVIPNGVDYRNFVDNSSFKKDVNKKVILSVGAIKARKGYDISIEAVSILKKQNLKYYIVGGFRDSDPFYKKIQKLIKERGLKEQVKLVGNVSDSELVKLYNICDIFLLTPHNINHSMEGFGLVYLEANACGKPVIGTCNCGAEEAIVDGYNGLLVPQNSPEKTAEAIDYLLDNPEVARKIGENGKRRAEEFSWENIQQKIAQIYKSALSS